MGMGCSVRCNPTHRSHSFVIPSIEIISEKWCARCRRFKPLTDEYWYRSHIREDGWGEYCRFCDNAYRTEKKRKRRMSKMRRDWPDSGQKV